MISLSKLENLKLVIKQHLISTLFNFIQAEHKKSLLLLIDCITNHHWSNESIPQSDQSCNN